MARDAVNASDACRLRRDREREFVFDRWLGRNRGSPQCADASPKCQFDEDTLAALGYRMFTSTQSVREFVTRLAAND